MAWYQTRKASKLSSMDRSRILVFDTETTGIFRHRDEIIQLTILDGYGSILYSSYIRPKHRKSWKKAERVNHISYEMVKDYPSMEEEKDKIQEIFNNAKLIVGYNVNFDINLIENAGIIVLGERFDVMTEFAHFRADTERQRYYNCKLIECADYFGYSFTPHNAEEDANATLYCFDQLISNPIFTTYQASQKKELKKQIEEARDVNTPYEAVKIEIVFQGKTARRRPVIIKGLLILLVGEILFYLNNHNWFSNYSLYIKELIKSINSQPVNYLELVSLTLIGIGIILIFFSVIKAIRNLPRWIVVLFKRLKNKYK